MGHSQADKQSTHERIVDIAAQRFCELGIDGLSISGLMKEAGLTHGGFYKHFDSREELVTEALAAALKRSDAPQRSAASTFDTLVTGYLSTEHRDALGTGCAVGALVNDMGRAHTDARDLYTHKLTANFRGIAQLLHGTDASSPEDAMVAFSAMVGALGLSRAVADPALSEAILDAVRNHLLTKFAPSSHG